MKSSNFISIIMLCAGVSLSAQWKSISGPEGSPVTANVLEDGVSGTVIEFDVAGYNQKSIDIESRPYVMLSVPDAPIFLEKGYPELPRVNRSIVIPDQAKMSIEITEAEYDTVDGVQIAPSKGSLSRSIDPQTVPYTFSDFYKTDTFWPTNTVELSQPFIIRDIRGITVRFNLFRHNALKKQLIICKHLVARVYADGIDDVNVKRSRRTHPDHDFYKLYQRFFLNYSENKVTSLGKATYNDIGETGRMLIIAADDFYDSMIPLRDWRTRKGYRTRLVKCSDVGTTVNDIQDYMQDMYDEAGSVTYILLVGEGNTGDIPSTSVPYPGTENAPKDPTYAKLAGGDDYPDAYISRLSAENFTQVENQVRRIIKYETNPPSGAWFKKACGIASHQYSPADSTRCSWLRDDLLGYGYTTVDKLYDYEADGLIPWAINSGRGIVNYIGHGLPLQWKFNEPYIWDLFDVDEVQNLSNTNLLPFVFSVACEVGSFSDYSTCFAEAWLRSGTADSPIGAIGFYGSSIWQPQLPPCTAQAEAVDLLVANDKITIGGLCFNGSCKMIEDYPYPGPGVFNTWHIFGDAATQLWTDTPSQFSSVTITENGDDLTVIAGVSGCTICVSSGNNGATCHLVKDNVASYTFDTDGIRPLYISITKHNYLPYTAVIGGTFTSDETWSGELHVINNVTISTSNKLNVIPGTTLKFASGCYLYVDGILNVLGTSANHVTFTRSGSSGTWGGIRFNSGSSGTIQYADISNATYGVYLISSSSVANIQHCNFTQNNYGARINHSNDTQIINCNFQNNTYGIYPYYADCDIENNTFSNNYRGIYTYRCSPALNDNEINNNTNAGIYAGTYSSPILCTMCSYGSGNVNNYIHHNPIGFHSSSTATPNLGIYIPRGSAAMGGFNYFLSNSSYDVRNDKTYYELRAEVNWWEPSAKIYGSVGLSPDAEDLGFYLPKPAVAGKPDDSANELLLSAQILELDSAYTDAITQYKQIIDKYSKTGIIGAALTGIERCHRKLKSETELISYLDELYDTYSQQFTGALALYFSAGVYARSSDYQAALSRLEEAEATFRSLPDFTEETAWVMFDQGQICEMLDAANDGTGRLTRAGDIYEKILKDFPDTEAAAQLKDLVEFDEPPPESPAVVIKNTALLPAYPNPFNPITTITFSLSEASRVRTEIYDLTGKCVAVLCDRHYPAGTYSVQFDGSALASGVYILRSRMTSTENQGKSQVFTRKMMLMK